MTACLLLPIILYFFCSKPACYDKSHLFLSLCSMTLIKLTADIHDQNPDHLLVFRGLHATCNNAPILPAALRLDYEPFCLFHQFNAPTCSLDFPDCFLASQKGVKKLFIRIFCYLIAYACQCLQLNSLFKKIF